MTMMPSESAITRRSSGFVCSVCVMLVSGKISRSRNTNNNVRGHTRRYRRIILVKLEGYFIGRDIILNGGRAIYLCDCGGEVAIGTVRVERYVGCGTYIDTPGISFRNIRSDLKR